MLPPGCLLIFIQIALIAQCKTSQDSADPKRYSTIEWIEKSGYPAENHYVTTTDGYILNLNRVPGSKNRITNGKVALLTHGFLLSSVWFVFPKPQEALGLILADEGYDVWMLNYRGSEYSRNHTTLNPDKDPEFWDFSIHEMGVYDNAASIDYILNKTNVAGVYYLGFSQGSASIHILTASRPEYNSKIKTFICMAPFVLLNNVKSPLFTAPAPLINNSMTRQLLVPFEKTEFLPTGGAVSNLTLNTCKEGSGRSVCQLAFDLFFGLSPYETNLAQVPLWSPYFPQGASTKQYIHFLQFKSSGEFKQFDYSGEENVKRYNQTVPPAYDLTATTARACYIFSKYDSCVDHTVDLPRLLGILKNNFTTYEVPVPFFSHSDFLLGKSAPSEVYSKVLECFDKF